ncbi:uncharacterized protein LOC142336567 [Convolutriloba macropyga]|uniref:uncharacterized protein LOC142336567 n=1 Tax=Convolutriloba macropyga TaxID=536237 RepID=UPI003F521B88
MPLDDYLPNHRLSKFTISSTILNLRFCSLKCLQNYNCRSFNFCPFNHICELNSFDRHDPLSTGYLKFFKECVYIGMRKATEPICYEHGNRRAVSDDSIPNFCRINGKRLDGIWGPWKFWKTTPSSDGFEWRKEEKRECTTPLHGGLWCYGDNIRITEWIYLSRNGKKFDDAQKNCSHQNGILLEATGAALLNKIAKKFVDDKSDFKEFWVGFKSDKPTITRLSNGISFPYTDLGQSIWDAGEPSGSSGESYVKAQVNRASNDQINVRFHDTVNDVFQYVCDKAPRN